MLPLREYGPGLSICPIAAYDSSTREELGNVTFVSSFPALDGNNTTIETSLPQASGKAGHSTHKEQERNSMTEATSGETTSRYPFQPLEFERLSPEEALRRSQVFLTSMRQRRTIRAFAPDPVPFVLIENAIATAATAPSGANRAALALCRRC